MGRGLETQNLGHADDGGALGVADEHHRSLGLADRRRQGADAGGDAPDLTASLWQEQGTHTAGVGSHGRFEFAGVPRGLTRLDLLATGSDSAFRTTLFEI